MGGDTGLERLPAGGGALVDIHLGRRTAGSHHRNHLSGIADRVREPRVDDGQAHWRENHSNAARAYRSAQQS